MPKRTASNGGPRPTRGVSASTQSKSSLPPKTAGKTVSSSSLAVAPSSSSLRRREKSRGLSKPTVLIDSNLQAMIRASAKAAKPLSKPSEKPFGGLASIFVEEAQEWEPHAGQKKAVTFLLHHMNGALLADVGVGKTSITLATFKLLKSLGRAKKMLVIAPLRPCYMVWPEELKKWSNFAGLTMEVLHGPKKDKALAREADIYVINPDGLEWLLDAKTITHPATGKKSSVVDASKFAKLGFDLLVIDELTAFKSPSSLRFKMMKAVVHTFKRRWGLTGTPAPNGLIDLFGQCYILDMGASLGQYISHYRSQYFMPSYSGHGWTLRKGCAPLIYERIKNLTLRLEAQDYIDMPEQIENVIRFDMPERARKIYEVLERDLIVKLDEDMILAPSAAALSMKCRQISSGAVYVEDEQDKLFRQFKIGIKHGQKWVDIHDEKIKILAELVEELQGQPLLVGYEFNHDLERIQRHFGGNVPYIGAGVGQKRTAELEKAWNRGELPILLGHPQAIGHGLNLQGAGNHVCWFSITWNYELYSQFVGRVKRQGSRFNRVFVHLLVARNTIEEIMVYALKHKRTTQTDLLDALKKLGEERKKGFT